jgi:hypothetical protein
MAFSNVIIDATAPSEIFGDSGGREHAEKMDPTIATAYIIFMVTSSQRNAMFTVKATTLRRASLVSNFSITDSVRRQSTSLSNWAGNRFNVRHRMDRPARALFPFAQGHKAACTRARIRLVCRGVSLDLFIEAGQPHPNIVNEVSLSRGQPVNSKSTLPILKKAYLTCRGVSEMRLEIRQNRSRADWGQGWYCGLAGRILITTYHR